MKTAPLTKQIATERELLGMNADQIKKDVLSGHPRNSLQQQREARRTQAPVGRLDSVTELNAAAEATPEALKKLNEEFLTFRSSWPQVILDTSEDGVHNKTEIAQWLEARNASFTASNFVKCVQDIFQSLVFAPARIGMASLGERMIGSVMVRSTTSAQFEKLLAPFSDAPKSADEMSSAEYKWTHESDWDDLRQPVRNMEVAYVADAVNKFMQMAPQYIPTDANREMLLGAIGKAGLRINQARLLAVFNELVAAKKMKVNEFVDATVGSTRRYDFNG